MTEKDTQQSDPNDRNYEVPGDEFDLEEIPAEDVGQLKPKTKKAQDRRKRPSEASHGTFS